jgi:hypothetical protein
MKKKTKIVLGISVLFPLVLALVAVYFFFFGHDILRRWFWMEIHDETRLVSFLANIEDNTVVKFPEKIESLKAAERVHTNHVGSYHFVLRFKTDNKGLAQLQESLSQLRKNLVSDAQTDPNSGVYVYPRIVHSKKGIPEWYSEEIPEGVHYESIGAGGRVDYSGKNRNIAIAKIYVIDCKCVTLAGSEEVVVYMEGVL